MAGGDPGPDPTDPTEEPEPGPGADTTAPTLGVPTVTPTVIACDVGYTFPPQGTVRAAASDDRGVTRVEIRWSGVVTGNALMTSGSPWTYLFDPVGNHSGGDVTFRVTAFDAAGNASPERTVNATVDCIG